MLNLESVLKVVLWIALGVLAIDVSLVIYILRRRLSRWLYYNRKDAVAKQSGGIVRQLVTGELSPAGFAIKLQSRRAAAERDAIRDLLLDGLAGDSRKTVTEALFRLGYIKRWAREAFGRRRTKELLNHIIDNKPLPPARKSRFNRIRRLRLFSIRRARAVHELVHLDARFSKVFMQEALSDPSPYVARANVSAMGRSRQDYELPVLLNLLRKAIQGSNDLAVTSVKTALVRYPIGYLDHFAPLLDDTNPLCRFVVVDCIREVCDAAGVTLNAGDFPENLYRWFVDKAAYDKSFEVRARGARVVRHFHDAAAVATLRIMLRDTNEFVRLHTVRACADPYYSDLIDDIVPRLTDARWRVREAAVKTLATFGKAGRRQLGRHFLDTSDRFAGEQIVEEMERSGVIFEMLPALGGENGDRALTEGVCAKMVQMGCTSLLTDTLTRGMSNEEPAAPAAQLWANNGKGRARERLLDLLLAAPTTELTSLLQSLASHKEDPLSVKAQAVLRSLDPGMSAPMERKAHA
jgi:HEAT repeats